MRCYEILIRISSMGNIAEERQETVRINNHLKKFSCVEKNSGERGE